MQFKPATRSAIIPLIGMFGKSGTGKTFSALRVMRGIIGPQGRMGCIDTENGRLSINVNRIPEGMDRAVISASDAILDMQPPFHPLGYCEALELADQQQIDGLVVDSATHEWIGYLQSKEDYIDGKLGNEREDWKKRDKLAIPAAARCKPAHNKFIAMLLRARLPIILCFRGKDKIKMDKEKFTTRDGQEREKTVIIAPEHASPIQDSGLIYEMLIAMETLGEDEKTAGGYRVTKYTHPDLLKCLPEGQRLCEATGERIAEWCRNPGPKPPAKPDAGPLAELFAARPEIVKETHGQTKGDYLNWLIAEGHVLKTETFAGMSESRIREVITKVKEAKF